MVHISTEDKTRIYSAAVIEALAVAGNEVGAPDINAAIAALTYAQGYIISGIEDRNLRRQAEKAAVDGLGNHVAAFDNKRIIEAQEKAKEAGE